jgi:lysyl-tRNA synthetase class 2
MRSNRTSSVWWNPAVFARRKANLDTRRRVIAGLRAYFDAAGFAEVETPCLQSSPGNEVHLQVFATEWKDQHPGTPVQKLYLHTSPEFAMKKLLVAGMPKIFQFAHVFRNGERSSLHHPEFLMCEWYRADADLAAIRKDCIALVRRAAEAAGRKVFAANGMNCDPFHEWEILSVSEAFRRFADIDLLATAPDPTAPDAGLLAFETRRIGLRAQKGDSWDDLFFRIMGEKIEPFLGKDRPTFLGDYPVSMAALARPNSADPRVAERFELYICGIELANAFGELTDAKEQRRRFEADMALKEKLYGARVPIDEDFLAALGFGMPDSAGIAFGIDRLVMLCTGADKIEDILWAPVAAP